jgi:hypothetical protein
MMNKVKSPRAQVADTRHHTLVVGADRVGSLVERAGEFHAYDVAGHCVGIFSDMRTASRAIPRVAS